MEKYPVCILPIQRAGFSFITTKTFVMKPEEILKSDVLDILFENRHKAYGAYVLRKAYHRRLTRAVLSTTLLVCLFALVQSWKVPKKVGHVYAGSLWADTIRLVTVPLEKERPKQELPKPKQLAQQQYVQPVITPDDQVKETVPDVEILEHAMISHQTLVGDTVSESLVTPPVVGDQDGSLVPAAPVEAIPMILEKAEQMPEFPGGKEAMIRFLMRNLPQPDDIAEGEKLAVLARFVVDTEGHITNIEIERTGRLDLDQSVLKAIGKMPRWKPGMQNGRPVPVYFRLPVTFVSHE
jgi:periplasmic protein TonB